MACRRQPVLLGYEDGQITDKYLSSVNYTFNKIGGKPDFPPGAQAKPYPCSLCGLNRYLVLQIYAPLENSKTHRTLYLFACINPNCWNLSESWLCLRCETLDTTEESAVIKAKKTSATDWCDGADDWDNETVELEDNGNVEASDEESSSLEESLRMGLEQLDVDEENANTNSFVAGALGGGRSPIASADIDGEEGEVVSIDPPPRAQQDLGALLAEARPLPPELYGRKTAVEDAVQFAPLFVSVHEEAPPRPDRRVRELLLEYQRMHGGADATSPGGGGGHNGDVLSCESESYERSLPAHGDQAMHSLLVRLQANPGQVVRYCRDDGAALPLAPLPQVAKMSCRHCRGPLVFELQLLPTLIPKLVLRLRDRSEADHLDYGTVLVFTCRQSCRPHQLPVVLEEAVVVQAEN